MMTPQKTAKTKKSGKQKDAEKVPEAKRVRVYFPREATPDDMVDRIRELCLNYLPEEKRAAQIELWEKIDAEEPEDKHATNQSFIHHLWGNQDVL